MHIRHDHLRDLTIALERQVEMQAQAAKRAIREYKKSLSEGTRGSGTARSERQREVTSIVNTYMQLRKRLDEVRAQEMSRIDPLRS